MVAMATSCISDGVSDRSEVGVGNEYKLVLALLAVVIALLVEGMGEEGLVTVAMSPEPAAEDVPWIEKSTSVVKTTCSVSISCNLCSFYTVKG